MSLRTSDSLVNDVCDKYNWNHRELAKRLGLKTGTIDDYSHDSTRLSVNVEHTLTILLEIFDKDKEICELELKIEKLELKIKELMEGRKRIQSAGGH